MLKAPNPSTDENIESVKPKIMPLEAKILFKPSLAYFICLSKLRWKVLATQICRSVKVLVICFSKVGKSFAKSLSWLVKKYTSNARHKTMMNTDEKVDAVLEKRHFLSKKLENGKNRSAIKKAKNMGASMVWPSLMR